MEDESYVLSLVELSNLVEKNIKPEWWNSSTKITYGFAKSVFERVEEYIFTKGGNQEDLVRKALLLDPNLQIGKKLPRSKGKPLMASIDRNLVCVMFAYFCTLILNPISLRHNYSRKMPKAKARIFLVKYVPNMKFL